MAQAQGHILIVDDEPAVVYTLRAILEKVGYTISEAQNMEQVECVLKSSTVDVVLCDLGLGGGQSGISVLEKIGEMSPEVGQILLTGYAPPEVIDELEAKGVPVFMKPVEMGRLLPELLRIMEQKAA
jgi:DNA-binding NtrC family response regulator